MVEIIQGSNSPIVLEFSEDISTASKIEVSLNDKKKEFKHWDISNMTVDGNTIMLPLTESETLDFEDGAVYIDVKLLDADGTIIFFDSSSAFVTYKYDKTHLTEV